MANMFSEMLDAAKRKIEDTTEPICTNQRRRRKKKIHPRRRGGSTGRRTDLSHEIPVRHGMADDHRGQALAFQETCNIAGGLRLAAACADGADGNDWFA